MKKIYLFKQSLVLSSTLLFFAHYTQAQSWSLSGNAGTDPNTNFIGTIDKASLQFKVNNVKAGYLDFSNGNTGFGYQTLSSNTGALNTANGSGALYRNTTGYYNVATGGYAMQNNKKGISNTANGISSLRWNSNGNDNTATGANTLFNNISGHSNVAIGSNALFNNTTQSNLVAIGDSALYNNGIGAAGFYDATGNTAVGSKALFSNTTGYDNIATGSQALYSNTSGSQNTANGTRALYSDTSGAFNTATGAYALYTNKAGSWNTANGGQALYHNTTGNYNTANGMNALWNSTTGNFNAANGFDALWQNDVGVANTADGAKALQSNMAGNNNTALGYSADVSRDSLTNAMALGYNATVNASNKVMIGNAGVMVIGGHVNWSILSDGRFKTNIKENVPGLTFINKLKPVTYNLELKKFDKFLGKKDSLINSRQAEYAVSEKKVHTGFVAQDVETAAQELHYDFDGVNHPQNDKDNYSLAYADFVPSLVKAVQELSKMNDNKDAKINDLETRLAKLEAIMNMQQSTTNLSSASLGQNVPNPFSKATSISYSLPQKYSSAKIIVIDESGNTIKIFNLSGTGKGSINFSSPFRVGVSYQYSLLIDGKLIDTKQMVLAK